MHRALFLAALAAMARRQSSAERISAAAIEADRALALDPTLAEGLFEAAAAAAETGDRPAARDYWLRLIRSQPDHPLASTARRNLAAQG